MMSNYPISLFFTHHSNRLEWMVSLVLMFMLSACTVPSDLSVTDRSVQREKPTEIDDNNSSDQVEPEPKIMMVTLSADVDFDFGKMRLKPAARAALRQLVSDMQQVEVNSIDVVGHTDAIEGLTERQERAVSEARANQVRNFLIENGISAEIISTSGMGAKQPIAPNIKPDGSDNPVGRARNRRADIMVDAEMRI